MKTLLRQHERMKASNIGGFRLPVQAGILSPYFRANHCPQEIGAGRDLSLNIEIIMARTGIILNYGPGGSQAAVTFTSYQGGAQVSGDVVYFDAFTAVTQEDVAALALAAINAWATTNGYTYTSFIDMTRQSSASSPVESALSLSVQSSTGAVGTQVSATRDAWVLVDGSSSTTANIAGNAAVDLVLEVAPTNSATAGDWVVKGRTGNSQALTLAITLQSVQVMKGQMVAFVPKGYYVKLRQPTATGTASGAFIEGRQVLI